MWSFIKICLICIIDIYRLKVKLKKKNPEHMLNYSLPCSCNSNLSSFWFIIKQQITIEEISFFSNSSHLEWNVGLSDTILQGDHSRTIPTKFGLIWFSSFRREDLNGKVYDLRPTDNECQTMTKAHIKDQWAKNEVFWSLSKWI